MNALLQKLAQQAGVLDSTAARAPAAHKFLPSVLLHPATAGQDTVGLEKFAELIVQQCIDVLNPEGDLTSMGEEGWRRICMREIKQHFGVEEE